MSYLRTRVLRGVGWTVAQKLAVRFSALVVFVLLSRWLTREDIGLAALALAISGFVGAFAELSLGAYIVRHDDPDDTTLSTVFWTGVVGSTLAGVVVFVAADPIASLVGDDRLTPLIRAYAPLLLVGALGAVPSALIERRLEFRSLALRETLAATVSGAAGIGAAVAGAGVWALVVQSWVQAVVALVTIVAIARWRPRRRFSRQTLGEIGRFGGPLLGVQLAQNVRDRGEQIVLGGILGVAALGTWTIATRILAVVADLSVSVLDVVALPVFAKVRSEPARLQRAYEQAVAACQAVLVPIVLVLAVAAPVLIPAVFGAQWHTSVVPTQLLCLAYAIGGLGYFNRAVLVATNRLGTELALTLGGVAVHMAIVVSVAPHGVAPLAFAMWIETVAVLGVSAWALASRAGLKRPISMSGLRTLAAGAAGAAVAFGTESLWSGGVATATLLSAVVAFCVFAAVMLLINRAFVRTMRADVRAMLRRSTEEPAV